MTQGKGVSETVNCETKTRVAGKPWQHKIGGDSGQTRAGAGQRTDSEGPETCSYLCPEPRGFLKSPAFPRLLLLFHEVTAEGFTQEVPSWTAL